jgi:hypothetical protein
LITILFILNLTIEKVCTDSLVSSAIRIRCPLTIISVQVANSQLWCGLNDNIIEHIKRTPQAKNKEIDPLKF